MKKQLTLFLMLLALGWSSGVSAQICNSNGNVVIFSNYDGGVLNIDVDVDIPNLKIGVVSYEAVTINLSGAYVGNVVEVNYSGFNNAGGGCPMAPASTTINGAGSAVTSIDFAPAATYSDPDGYSMIICSYQCGPGTNGGCNSPLQIAEFYTTKFGGDLYSHETQYGCWSGTQSISAGGNCCLMPAVAPVADFSVDMDETCVNGCIQFTDLSTNSPDSWTWTISGTAGPSIQNPTICFTFPGTFIIELEASNSAGSSIFSLPVTVYEVDNGVTVTGFTLEADAAGATYQWLDCNNGYAEISGETNATYEPANDGSYAVSVTMNGCTDTSDCEIISGLGLNNLSPDMLSVYPNPSTGTVTVETPGNWSDATIRITNVAGETLQTVRVNASKTQLNLASYAKGIYFISLETSGGKVTQKITLQ